MASATASIVGRLPIGSMDARRNYVQIAKTVKFQILVPTLSLGSCDSPSTQKSSGLKAFQSENPKAALTRFLAIELA